MLSSNLTLPTTLFIALTSFQIKEESMVSKVHAKQQAS